MTINMKYPVQLPLLTVAIWVAAFAFIHAEDTPATLVLGLQQNDTFKLTRCQLIGGTYEQVGKPTGPMAFPLHGVALGDADNDGANDIVWSYHNTKENNFAIPVSRWDGDGEIATLGHVASDWKARVCGVAVGELTSANPGNELLIAAEDDGVAKLSVLDFTGRVVRPILYVGEFNGVQGVAILDIALGDVDNDGSLDFVAAYRQDGRQNIGFYRIATGPGRAVATSRLETIEDWTEGEILAVGVGKIRTDGPNMLFLALDDAGSCRLVIYALKPENLHPCADTEEARVDLPIGIRVTGIGAVSGGENK